MKKYNSYNIKMSLGIGLILFSFIFFSSAWAKDSIRWIHVNYLPFGIVDGPNKGKGMLDQITKFMQTRLLEYEHQECVANIIRLLSMLEKEDNACICGLNMTPDRENKFYFSIPAIIFPGVGIVTRKDLIHVIGNTKRLSLHKLLKNEYLTLGIPADRSFGEKIDPIINKHNKAKNILYIKGQSLNKSLMEMMMFKRIDYMIARPNEAMYLAKEIGKEDIIINIPLEEAEAYLISYIACSKNERGRQVIHKINQILEKERNTTQYRALMEKWLDENSIIEFRKIYQSIFFNNRVNESDNQ